MNLKRLLVFSCIFIMLYLQYGRAPIVNHSITCKNANNYETTLTVTANKLFILNQKQLSDNLIAKVQSNDFQNMQFSYNSLDVPNEMTITVYTNCITYHWNIPAFTFKYTLGPN